LSSPPEPIKEKRGVVSGKRRRQLLLLVTEYQVLQTKFPSLRDDIQSNIDGHLRQAERTRAADRQAVLNDLRKWPEGLNADEIVMDTGLAEWTVRGVLDELQKTEIVGVYERAQDEGKPTKVFFIRDDRPA
jgi:hypothetical protein